MKAMKKLAVTSLLFAVSTWTYPAYASSWDRTCTRTGLTAVLANPIGPVLIAMMLAATILWISEEAKAEDASPKRMAIFIGAATFPACLLLYNIGVMSDNRSMTGTILVLLLGVTVLKILMLYRRPRLGRAIPAMVLTYVILAEALTDNVNCSAIW